ncbi:hypothetical protein ACFYKX_15735 [Cytobacillus sp. FJAT-54145]|uniref:Metallo-beta-lactamase domain-containing protein n=1 Tax=Cytobacillus spartinae TaxID=3299023 RepID=A0ABW6KGS2_9BACI
MNNYICSTCGVQYDATEDNPLECKICMDDRQYVPSTGQKWTTLHNLKQDGYTNEFVEVEPNLIAIKTKPQVGIGQTAYLMKTPEGNVLWDCITYIDEDTVQRIQDMGGLKAIAISHPHYYSAICEWAEIFNCPIYIHESDQEWTTRKSDHYVFWKEKSLRINSSIELINLGGHFKGSSVLLWKSDTNPEGVLLVGDTILMVPDSGWVSFMYSYPNRIPLSPNVIKNIRGMIIKYEFNRLYDAFGKSILEDGKGSVIKSADRYLKYIEIE